MARRLSANSAARVGKPSSLVADIGPPITRRAVQPDRPAGTGFAGVGPNDIDLEPDTVNATPTAPRPSGSTCRITTTLPTPGAYATRWSPSACTPFGTARQMNGLPRSASTS